MGGRVPAQVRTNRQGHMNGRQRRKLFAGAGLITMLLGALLTLAPTGAGATDSEPAPTIYNTNVQCQTAGQGNVVGLGYDDSVEFGAVETGDLEGVSFTSYLDANNVRHFVWASDTLLIGAVIVKQANGAAVFSYEPEGAMEGTVYVGTGKNRSGISHISFCFGGDGTQPATGSITVEKDVTGDAQPPAATTEYDFTVACELGEEPVVLDEDSAAFSLLKDATKTISGLPLGATCTVTEIDAQGANTVTYTVGESSGFDPAEVTVIEGAVGVLVTNDFPPRQPGTGDLTVSKVAGTNAPNPSPAFTFTVDCEDGDPIDLNGAETAGTQVTFNLTFGQSRSFEDLPEGATCDVVETVNGNASSTTHTVNAGALQNGATATDVAITDGGNSTVAFTNNFPGQSIIPVCVDDASTPGDDCNPEPPEVIEDVCPRTPGRQTMIESCVEVLPAEVTRPTPPAPPAPPAPTPPAEPQPEVKGDVVARTLPRTGSESQDLAAFGAGLLLLGAGLVLTSRSRFARAD